MGLPLIGNSTSGIYHAYTHKNYGDVHPKNQVHFWTEREAQDAGYRRAANDHYGPGSGQPKTVEEARQRLRQGIDTLTAQQGAFRRVRLRRGQDQDGVGAALRIRLFEEEQRRQERDHGMSL